MSTATNPTVKVGDYFYSSWGYDQTNINYFKVVGLSASGKSVKVQEVTSPAVSSSGYHDEVVPGEVMRGGRREDGTYDPDLPAPVQTKRLRLGGYKGASFYWTSYADAYLWDGKPKYQTDPRYGH